MRVAPRREGSGARALSAPEQRGGLGHRSRRRRPVLLDVGLEAWTIRLAVDDEVVGVVLEAIDGTLAEQRVVEDGEPVGGVAIAGDDRSRASSALDEELVDVAALVAGHR